MKCVNVFQTSNFPDLWITPDVSLAVDFLLVL